MTLQIKIYLLNYYYLNQDMKNPFDALGGSDDQATGYTTVNKKDSEKQTQNQRNQPKKLDNRDTKQVVQLNADLNLRKKQDLKVIRNPRQPRPNKEITDHHAHDRRSGTGRVSEPRKNIGGGVRNIKDELDKDNILKRVREQGDQEGTQVQKEPQPVTLTLEQYYAKQGVDISKLDKKVQHVEKKDPVNAEWITKQKLTVMKTRADNDIEDKNRKVQTIKEQSHKIVSSPEQQLLGFTSSVPQKQQRERKDRQEPRATGDNKKGGKPQYDVKKQTKPIINEQDFPSL